MNVFNKLPQKRLMVTVRGYEIPAQYSGEIIKGLKKNVSTLSKSGNAGRSDRLSQGGSQFIDQQSGVYGQQNMHLREVRGA